MTVRDDRENSPNASDPKTPEGPTTGSPSSHVGSEGGGRGGTVGETKPQGRSPLPINPHEFIPGKKNDPSKSME